MDATGNEDRPMIDDQTRNRLDDFARKSKAGFTLTLQDEGGAYLSSISARGVARDVATLVDGHDRMLDAIEKVLSWAAAYPISVFPEPDLKKAHELLKAGGMTLDAVSARAMRHVLKGVLGIMREALTSDAPPNGQ